MIPVKLKLNNFMCFSNIEVDFSSVKTACLTGKNGSGKSSLLDAMTWALWNMARASSDKLIKIGSQHMSVELEFSLDDNRYKVVRYYHKSAINKAKKTQKSSLELFSFDRNKRI